MRSTPAFVFALALAGASCFSEPPREGWDELRTAVASVEAPVKAVYFWAPWSRSSVELKPSIEELGREYEGALSLLQVCLSEAPDDGCGDPADGSGWTAPLDFERLFAEYGVAEPPALVVFGPGGRGVLSGETLTPAAAADAIEAALGYP